ncbi:metallophosphoesterase family protein [Clostridium sediminicola]|uniref:metallophosphoesterase family protein n=1 Tax=Clostridium sediminicola TaxID=3114879 RepID=UPI0031F25B79
MMDKKIGVISDTHGFLRTEVKEWFNDVDLIIHAGDVGNIQVLEELKAIAPVVAVRGNVDRDDLTKKLASWELIEIGNKSIYIIHNIDMIDIEPKDVNIDMVVFGHSHVAEEKTIEGVLYLNPGSAGPKRFLLPSTAAILQIEDNNITIKFINL